MKHMPSAKLILPFAVALMFCLFLPREGHAQDDDFRHPDRLSLFGGGSGSASFEMQRGVFESEGRFDVIQDEIEIDRTVFQIVLDNLFNNQAGLQQEEKVLQQEIQDLLGDLGVVSNSV